MSIMGVPASTRLPALLLVTGSVIIIVGSILTYVYWDSLNRDDISARAHLLCGPIMVAGGLIVFVSGTCLRISLWQHRVQYGLTKQSSTLDDKCHPNSILDDKYHQNSTLDEKYHQNSILDDKYHQNSTLDDKYLQTSILHTSYDGTYSSPETHIYNANSRRSSLMMQVNGGLPGDMTSRLPQSSSTSRQEEAEMSSKSNELRVTDMPIQVQMANKKRRDTLAVIHTESIHNKEVPVRRMSLHDQCSFVGRCVKSQSAQCVNAVKQRFKFHKASITLEEEAEIRVSILGHIYRHQGENREEPAEEIAEHRKCSQHSLMLEDPESRAQLTKLSQRRFSSWTKSSSINSLVIGRDGGGKILTKSRPKKYEERPRSQSMDSRELLQNKNIF